MHICSVQFDSHKWSYPMLTFGVQVMCAVHGNITGIILDSYVAKLFHVISNKRIRVLMKR